jgi:hypothetical protein
MTLKSDQICGCNGRTAVRLQQSQPLCRRIAIPSSAIAALLTLVCTAGCGGGSDAAHLKGTVTVNGQPLPADAIGTVTLQTTKPGQGKMASAPIKNGAYEVLDAPLGPLKVYITVQQPSGRTIDNGRGDPAQEYKNIISAKYASGIDIQVDGDNEALDFPLDGA